MEKKGVLGIDIGGTHIRAGYVLPDNSLVNFRKDDSRKILNGDDPPQNLLQYIHEYLKDLGEGERVVAISVGVPATVDSEKQMVISAPNIEGFSNLALVSLLENEFGLPAYMDRDVNMVFRYDKACLSLPDHGIGIGCYIGTGIGNVISIDGRLITGKNGAACELGHVPVMGRYERCNCGNLGCYENYASGRYLNSLLEESGGKSIAELLSTPEFQKTLDEFVDNIAVVVATEVNILDPEYVILGGGVLLNTGFPIGKLEQRIRDRARTPFPQQGLRIYMSREANSSGVIGAAIYARSKLNGDVRI